jgi:hypothetical protein
VKTLTLTIDADGVVEVSMTGHERNCLAFRQVLTRALGLTLDGSHPDSSTCIRGPLCHRVRPDMCRTRINIDENVDI